MSTTPQNIMKAADALDRGIAMVTTCWLALDRAETADDRTHILDTLYESQRKLVEAAKFIGVYLQEGGETQ